MLKGNSSNLFTDLCMSSPTVTKRHSRGWKSSKYRTGSRGLQDSWRATGLCLHWKSEEVASKISTGMDHNRTDKQCQREWRRTRRKEIFSSSIAFKIILILIFWKWSVITSFLSFLSLPKTLPRYHPCQSLSQIHALYFFFNTSFDLGLSASHNGIKKISHRDVQRFVL